MVKLGIGRPCFNLKKCSFGGRIPACDNSRQGLTDDRVSGRIDDRRQYDLFHFKMFLKHLFSILIILYHYLINENN